MDKVPPKPRRTQGVNREELLQLDKNDLVEMILRLTAHNTQLKNIISKSVSNESKIEERPKNNRPFDFSKCHYRRVFLHVLYFGWDYQGLAVQEDSGQTIEHHLFHALTKSCLISSRETSSYHRCGRTDKGVSAFGQVISISLRSKFAPMDQHTPSCIEKEVEYCKILNRLLPKEIRVVGWMPIPDDRPEYSARFDAIPRQYKYYFPRSALDLAAMRAACAHVVGGRDYRHLCKLDVNNGVTDCRRNIRRACVMPVDETCADSPTSMYYLLIEGKAFLWHQIRCIMGILLLIGEGKETPDVMLELLDVEKNPRKPQYSMALDIPLNLFRCTYELEETTKWVYSGEELKYIIESLQAEWTIHSIKTTMIMDVLNELEKYASGSETEDCDLSKERDSIVSYHECLLQGVRAKVYMPLLKRPTCSTLEERIEYYRKKRKVADDNVTPPVDGDQS